MTEEQMAEESGKLEEEIAKFKAKVERLSSGIVMVSPEEKKQVEEAWDKKLCDKEAKMGKGAPLDLCHMRERGLDGVNGPQNRAQVVHGP